MNQILLVEDSKLFGSVLLNEIQDNTDFHISWAKSYAEAEKLLKLPGIDFFISLLDLNLPDAPDGEIVDLVLSNDIPVIVFTGDMSDTARKQFWEKKVVDYVFKEGSQSINYIISLMKRIHDNHSIKAMVVDSSQFSRKIISELLQVHKYTIFEASNGKEALQIIVEHPDIKIVITDYIMEGMDGLELTKKLRESYDRHKLSIIALSDQDCNSLSAHFIKYGANDFLVKPFANEEFYCRVAQAVELLENVEDIKSMITSLEDKNTKLEDALEQLQITQNQMLQREKMASIGQLAAGVAHEINNPMGFITSNLGTLRKYLDKFTEYINIQDEILKEKGEMKIVEENRKKLKMDYISEDIKDLVTESLEGSDRVKDIVMGLKNFSRVDQAEQQMVSINECLDTTLKIVWNELKYKATVTKDYMELPEIKCYPQQLNQVFMNLLVNASHALDNQGEITIKTSLQDENVKVAISDTGCGIAEENITRLFEPFYTTKEVGKGTGLGLSIAYEIIKKHDGDIKVFSQLGKGTTFTVSLPVL